MYQHKTFLEFYACSCMQMLETRFGEDSEVVFMRYIIELGYIVAVARKNYIASVHITHFHVIFTAPTSAYFADRSMRSDICTAELDIY